MNMGTSLVYICSTPIGASCCNNSFSYVCNCTTPHVECSFKHILTNNSVIYKIPITLTITQFLEYINPRIRRDFTIGEYEVVFVSQTAEGSYSEYIDALTPSTITLATMLRYNEYPNSIGCFYIRAKNFIAENATSCPVCLCNIPNNEMNTNYYNCDHKICKNCFKAWRTKHEPNQLYPTSTNRRKCPLCRAVENHNLPTEHQAHDAIPSVSTIFNV